jgi:hypothetical protein
MTVADLKLFTMYVDDEVSLHSLAMRTQLAAAAGHSQDDIVPPEGTPHLELTTGLEVAIWTHAGETGLLEDDAVDYPGDELVYNYLLVHPEVLGGPLPPDARNCSRCDKCEGELDGDGACKNGCS